ncbi:MAG: ABC transporter permease [Lachnospiraceae bacterium]|nr:ABC transporter permease [Lachnospiraceae bacterium]
MGAFLLRIKLLLADRIASVCYVLCVIVMVSVFFNMNIHAADTSRVPVGIVCESGSQVAKRLHKALLESDALRATDGTLEELTELLMDGYIGSIFVIGDEYEKKLREGSKEDLIKVITPSDDTSSIIVQDIVAGYMMYDVCFFRTYDEYKSLPGPHDISPEEGNAAYGRMTEQEYYDYVGELAQNPMYGFDFDIEYIDIESSDRRSMNITTAMIYRQIIAGLIGMLLMVLVICGCNGFALEKGQSISKRRKTLGSNQKVAYILEMLAVLVYLTPAVLLSSLIMTEESGIAGAVYIFLLGEALCAFFIPICFLMGKAVGSASSYHLVGTVVCLVLGACGFISTFSGVAGTPMLGGTPVAIYIKGFTDMLV